MIDKIKITFLVFIFSCNQPPKINPEWQKIEDLNKSLTSVAPKKVTKKKLR